MENIRSITVKDLLTEYGPDAKFYVMDVQQSLSFVKALDGGLDRVISEMQLNKQVEEKYEEMLAGTSSTVSQQEHNSDCGTHEGGLKLPIVLPRETDSVDDFLETVHTISMGDDEVFYEGVGSEEQPIQID